MNAQVPFSNLPKRMVDFMNIVDDQLFEKEINVCEECGENNDFHKGKNGHCNISGEHGFRNRKHGNQIKALGNGVHAKGLGVLYGRLEEGTRLYLLILQIPGVHSDFAGVSAVIADDHQILIADDDAPVLPDVAVFYGQSYFGREILLKLLRIVSHLHKAPFLQGDPCIFP